MSTDRTHDEDALSEVPSGRLPRSIHSTDERPSAEERVERIATYWARALADAWRTVFPPRKEN